MLLLTSHEPLGCRSSFPGSFAWFARVGWGIWEFLPLITVFMFTRRAKCGETGAFKLFHEISYLLHIFGFAGEREDPTCSLCRTRGGRACWHGNYCSKCACSNLPHSCGRWLWSHQRSPLCMAAWKIREGLHEFWSDPMDRASFAVSWVFIWFAAVDSTNLFNKFVYKHGNFGRRLRFQSLGSARRCVK